MSSLTSSKTVRHGPVSHGTGFDTAGSLGSGHVFSHFRLGCPPPARSIEKRYFHGSALPCDDRVEARHKAGFPEMIPADLKRETFPLMLKACSQVALASFFEVRQRRIVILALSSLQSTHTERAKNLCRHGWMRLGKSFCRRLRRVMTQLFQLAIAGALQAVG